MSKAASGPAHPAPLLVGEIEPIIATSAIPAARADLATVVELPLLPACEDLYDKNVRTVVSSANVRDVQRGFAYITLDYTTMSDENRAVVEDVGAERSTIPVASGYDLEVAGLLFPITSTTTIEELAQRALERVSRFREQPMLWAPTYYYNADDGPKGAPTEADMIQKAKADGLYYDAEEGLYYLSEEHYRKTKGL